MDQKNTLESIVEIMNGPHGPIYAALCAICFVYGWGTFVQSGYSFTSKDIKITPGRLDPDAEKDEAA